MWIDKLIDGVLELDTPIGPRYVELDFTQRAYMMWTFRNFFSLPQQVLLPWERQLIDRLRTENRFVSRTRIGSPERPVIGRVEQRAPVTAEVVSIRNSSPRKPVSASAAATTEQNREAASA